VPEIWLNKWLQTVEIAAELQVVMAE